MTIIPEKAGFAVVVVVFVVVVVVIVGIDGVDVNFVLCTMV